MSEYLTRHVSLEKKKVNISEFFFITSQNSIILLLSIVVIIDLVESRGRWLLYWSEPLVRFIELRNDYMIFWIGAFIDLLIQ